MEQRQSLPHRLPGQPVTHMQKFFLKSEPRCKLILFTKMCSKWTRDLYANDKIMKLLENNTGENLDSFGYGGDFLDTIPEAPSTRNK